MSLTADLRDETRYMLHAARVTQKEAAQHLGISEKHLSQMMTGRATLHLDWAEAIAALCGRRIVIASTSPPKAHGGTTEAQEARE